MKRFLLIFFVSIATVQISPASFVSSEDDSRFTSDAYTEAAPGMLSPLEYIAKAKAALHKRYKEIYFREYNEPWVERRTYKDAPPADRDIICVGFVYSTLQFVPPSLARKLRRPGLAYPALLVLMRKDLSKVYINEVYYQDW